MTTKHDIPKTVGELVEVLKEYPADSQLGVFITEIYDNGSVYPTESHQMKVSHYPDSDYVELAFANGFNFPRED